MTSALHEIFTNIGYAMRDAPYLLDARCCRLLCIFVAITVSCEEEKNFFAETVKSYVRELTPFTVLWAGGG